MLDRVRTIQRMTATIESLFAHPDNDAFREIAAVLLRMPESALAENDRHTAELKIALATYRDRNQLEHDETVRAAYARIIEINQKDW